MSTLAPTNIKHPSSASNNIVLDSAGGVDLDALTVSGSAPADSVNIDASGNLLVGTSATDTVGVGSGGAQLQSVAANPFSAARFSNDAFGCVVAIGKSRGASAGSYTVVQNSDILGEIRFAGADGTDLQTVGAQINAEVDGTPGANDLPTRLVFSTTADGASSPTERMRIRNSGSTSIRSTISACLDLLVSGGANSSDCLVSGFHSSTDITSGTASIRIRTNGNIENTNNSYGSLSDIKLKENIVDAGSQWDDLKSLQVRKYNFKEGQTHTQIGLVAQEVELVSPGLVTESPDRDAEGNDLDTVTKSVNYSVLYMKAVKALQEAMERIEQLETEMAAVKAQLS